MILETQAAGGNFSEQGFHIAQRGAVLAAQQGFGLVVGQGDGHRRADAQLAAVGGLLLVEGEFQQVGQLGGDEADGRLERGAHAAPRRRVVAQPLLWSQFHQPAHV